MKRWEFVFTIPVGVNANNRKDVLKKAKKFFEWLAKEPLTEIDEFITIYEVENQ